MHLILLEVVLIRTPFKIFYLILSAKICVPLSQQNNSSIGVVGVHVSFTCSSLSFETILEKKTYADSRQVISARGYDISNFGDCMAHPFDIQKQQYSYNLFDDNTKGVMRKWVIGIDLIFYDNVCIIYNSCRSVCENLSGCIGNSWNNGGRFASNTTRKQRVTATQRNSVSIATKKRRLFSLTIKDEHVSTALLISSSLKYSILLILFPIIPRF